MSGELTGISVLIAGAGLAGLSAAHELLKVGADVHIVEARQRVGGRVWTIRDFADGQHAEAGGDFIDEGHHAIRSLAAAFHLPLVRVLKKGFAPSGNLFCPRALFQTVGGFGNGVSEDVDWSHRATGLNFRLGYAQGAVVGHPARRTWRELRGKWLRINSESYALMVRKSYGRLKWLLRALALPLSAVVHSGKVVRSRRIAGFRQKCGALAVLYRLRLWRMFDALRLVAGLRAD